jgi:hypothetical protein
MYPQVVQFDTRQLQMERELQFIRERKKARKTLETAAGSTRLRSLRLRTFLQSAGWNRRAARAQS